MFADSSGKFQVKVFQMASRKAKLSQFICMELFFDDAGDLVLSSEIVNTLAFRFEAKTLAKQNTR